MNIQNKGWDLEVSEKDYSKVEGTANAKVSEMAEWKHVFKEKQESQYDWSTTNENDQRQVIDYWGK